MVLNPDKINLNRRNPILWGAGDVGVTSMKGQIVKLGSLIFELRFNTRLRV